MPGPKIPTPSKFEQIEAKSLFSHTHKIDQPLNSLLSSSPGSSQPSSR